MMRGPGLLSRSLFILFVLVALAIVFSQLTFYQLGGHEKATLLQHLTATNHILAEFLFAAGTAGLLVNGGRALRVIGYGLFSLFIWVCSLQYAAIYLTGDFLTPTAIDNAQHIGLIMSPAKAVIAGALVVFPLIVVFIAEFFFKNRARKTQLLTLVIACFSVGALLRLDGYWLTTDLLAARATLFYSNVNLGNYTSPIQSFAQSLGQLKQTHYKNKPVTQAEQRSLAKFGISYARKSKYPLIKDFIYKSALPFRHEDKNKVPNSRLNVIVFFSEGLSARIIQPYNNQYPGLTPNIADFSRSAMRVDNYYNHTFATYRGLLGQLCSIFPVYAGGEINAGTTYYCLADLLNEEGYQTYFLFSQEKETTKLDEVLAKSNIQHIYGQEDLQKLYLNGESENRSSALSDQQFLQAVIAHLQYLEDLRRSGDKTPFFVGLYNIETHAFYDAGDDEIAYKAHDSYILDSIHNYDNAFGKFWEYFRRSDLYANTIVVFTADHAHFQGRDFVKLVGNQSDYQYYFVDKIPLLIYHPGLKLPPSFDADFASSIDLAPTIAHLLQLRNRANPFIGRSIFDRSTNESLAFGEGHVFLIGPDGIKTQHEYRINPVDDKKINLLYKAISHINDLEKQGRIWNGGTGQ
jgi:phosphoglycerol transferase MdoB-like AlkP superfamily enzyme